MVYQSESDKGFSHKQGGVRIFDASIKILRQGRQNLTRRPMESNKKTVQSVSIWCRVKILTSCHLCENPDSPHLPVGPGYERSEGEEPEQGS